jgi:uncharacterized protein YdeI (YjbR/CyaY-like superfamily)
MSNLNVKVDRYFIEGCGRCSFWNTPQCKVNNWQEEMQWLRSILLESGLTEELKWDVPCYTFLNKNVVILCAFKNYCALSFFKGALLPDKQVILSKPGENTQLVRIAKFTNVQEIVTLESTLKDYIKEAIELEKNGTKIEVKEKPILIYPEELQNKFEEDLIFKKAFESLTPGRQRAYNLHFSAPKQSSTRTSRIEKYTQQILMGKGLTDL